MGKVYQNKVCETCGITGKVIETFGHKYCKPCYDKRPKKGHGNSGMIGVKGLKPETPLPLFKGLEIERTTKGNKLFATLYLEHYPGSKGILGRQLNYFITKDGKVVGIIGVNSPPLNYKKFREFFKTDNEKLFVNNNVFRIVETEKNLGTKVLKIFRNRIKKDYKERYGDELIGIITFVEPPRTGAMYKADNWIYLGETQGKKCFRRGDMGKWINKEWTTGTKKLIFAKRL
jgi:hypothetical protein